MKTLILTGWGWTEYAVAAAVALRALKGEADVRGISRRRLPEFLYSEGGNWKRIYLVGIGLAGDETRLVEALKLHRKTEVVWISGIPMAESHQQLMGRLLKAEVHPSGLFNGALVKAVGKAFGVDVAHDLPFAEEKGRVSKTVAVYRELVAAAMYAHRTCQDDRAYETAIRYLAEGVPESAWSEEVRSVVDHYRAYGHRELVGSGEKMRELRSYIERIARHPEARVLILGESGTGKETVAQRIHTLSLRAKEPFYAFNCASLNKELLESRFFGHEKGAFTGADKQTQGLFELADGGTLFLDEIGELPLEAQGVLLRVLEGGRFMRVGGKEEIRTNVRLVTATNRDLPTMVREGKFREDLFMRLNVVQLRVPPLREHKEDIGEIADAWWFGRFRRHLSAAQISALMSYDYPGNVRELLNLLERAVVLEEMDFVRLIDRHREMNAGLQDEVRGVTVGSVPDELDAVIANHVRNVYHKYARNLSRAAAALKITRNTLRRYLTPHGDCSLGV